ncbi:unnamed protein product [Somion occarium]|uniref:Uncharacterized protein n=1 Tax=Somion occarium TaxID=3059160 RepID=A0ABP1DV25_9APHY
MTRSPSPSSSLDSEVDGGESPYLRFEKFHHPIRAPSSQPPSLLTGSIILLSSLTFLVLGGYATLFSAFLPRTGIYLLDVLADDRHYKYFVVLLIPTTAYFVIANWVGWQYYRNS